jgi:hypothetical protein
VHHDVPVQVQGVSILPFPVVAYGSDKLSGLLVHHDVFEDAKCRHMPLSNSPVLSATVQETISVALPVRDMMLPWRPNAFTSGNDGLVSSHMVSARMQHTKLSACRQNIRNDACDLIAMERQLDLSTKLIWIFGY